MKQTAFGRYCRPSNEADFLVRTVDFVHFQRPIPYSEGLELQRLVHHEVRAGHRGPTILCLEHPAVLTFGKNASFEHLLVSSDELASRGIECVKTDRGGDVTAHEVGQLVIYPILPVELLGSGPRKFVHVLEEVIIDLLKSYGVIATRDLAYPGVWVGNRKICSLGLRFANRVALHGVALNVDNGMEIFQFINPCGIIAKEVTSLALECPSECPSVSGAVKMLELSFARVAGLQICRSLDRLMDFLDDGTAEAAQPGRCLSALPRD